MIGGLFGFFIVTCFCFYFSKKLDISNLKRWTLSLVTSFCSILCPLLSIFSCGYYFRKTKDFTWFKAIMAGFAVNVCFMIFLGSSYILFMTDEERMEYKKTLALKEKEEKQLKAEKQKKLYARYAINYARNYLKKSLRDPDSYKEECSSSLYIEKKDYYEVVLEYRARNGFGGMSKEAVVVYVSIDDESYKIIDGYRLY